MLAVVEVGGKQYNVALGTKFKTEKINLAEGKTFDVEKVLLVSEEDGGGCKIGMPMLKDEKVEAKVVSHGKADKIRVFKMKAKKRSSSTQGHRQRYTEIEIVSIGGQKAKAAPVKKAVATAKKATTTAKNVTKAKKTDTMKPAVKKTVAKKATTASTSAKATADKKKTTKK